MIEEHFAALQAAAGRAAEHAPTIEAWGTHLSRVLCSGSRLLVCSDEAAGAEAGYLAAHLAGRFSSERGDAAVLVEGPQPARQVEALGQLGDVLITLSTGDDHDQLADALRQARGIGLLCWVIGGPPPDPITELGDASISIDAPAPLTVREIQLAVIHALSRVFDVAAIAHEPGAEGFGSSERRYDRSRRIA